MAGLLSDHFEDLQYRGAILPFGRTKKGSTVFATPGLLVDAIKSMELPGRALRGENVSADDVTKMAMDTMGGGGLLSRAIPTGDVGGLLGINVFHGGPNRWAPEPGFPQGRPRLDKVGTGESGQAYGHGFYSAEAPGVAQTYKTPEGSYKRLSGHLDPKTEFAFDLMERGYGTSEIMEKMLGKYGDNINFDEALKAIDGARDVGAGQGTLYKLDIPDADAAKFLDYDAPISGDLAKKLNEHPTVQRLNKEFGTENFYKPDQTGGDVYADLARKLAGAKRPNEFNSKAASEIFRDLDIPGVKYLDEGSRAAGEGTRNYVTWDQDVLDRTKILERDGKPVADRNVDAAGEPFVERNITDAGGKPFLDLVESEAKRATKKLKDAGFSVDVNPWQNRFGKSTYLKITAPDGRYGEIRVSDHTLGPSRYQDYVGHLKGTDEFGFKRLSYDEVVEKNDERLDIVINKIFKK